MLTALLLLCATPVWCGEDIRDVLQRSQRMQLEALTSAPVDQDGPEAAVLKDSFDKVLSVLQSPPADVRMVVVRGPLLAVCLMGRIIAVNVSVAGMTEPERLFILAHELGHTMHGHWDQLGALYKRHIPGEVVPGTTDPVARILGAEASELSHRQEYEADAFALRLLRRMDAPADTPIVMFRNRLPPVKATATHPSTQQRIAHLTSLR
jgi:hypothetical protein